MFANLAGMPVHAHEEYVIAVDTIGILDQADIHLFMHQVSEYIMHTCHLPVRSSCLHPFGIGLYKLDTTFHKDILIQGNPHDIDGVDVTFISQDRALNRRVMNYTRYGWLMLLEYPLDYRSLEYIDQALAPFAKMVTWHNNGRSLGYVLVKCLYNGAESVPRSLVLRQGDKNGTGWSWTVPVFILNWEHLDVFHPDIEDVPPNGNPHPLPQPPPQHDVDQAHHLADQLLHNVAGHGNAQQGQDAVLGQPPQEQEQEQGQVQDNEPQVQNDYWEAAAQAQEQDNQGWLAWPQPLPAQNQVNLLRSRSRSRGRCKKMSLRFKMILGRQQPKHRSKTIKDGWPGHSPSLLRIRCKFKWIKKKAWMA
jgi:hypothetical protein